MLLWILIAVLTALAALSILVPLARFRKVADEPARMNADEAVYREQLAAIDRDRERGLVDDEAAEAARTEIARRLLAAHDRAGGAGASSGDRQRLRIAQMLALVALPVFALGLYMVLGSPDTPDQPLTARLDAPDERQSIEVLVAKVERHLADNPEDGQGWAVVAPVYMRLGDAQASARAYANAIRLQGARPDWLTDMGEAMTIANQGTIPDGARRAFEQAVSLDAEAVKPRFFLAIALGQEGKRDEAVQAWNSLLDGADESQAWVPAARAQLAALTGEAPPAAGQAPGPKAEDIAAASQMSEDERGQMIRGMVAGLAERLASDGGTAAEWNRLIRAYSVLGDQEAAQKALDDAEQALAEDPAGLSEIKATGRELGLSGS